MANNLVSIAIWTASGTTPVLATTGSYDLRVSPFSSTGIVGVHQGAGVWNFTGISDIAEYKLYNTATGNEVAGFTGGGTNTRVFFDGDLQNYIRHNGTIAFTANQAMGGFKLTGLGAGTTNGDAVRYEQVLRTTGTQAGTTGTKTFVDACGYSSASLAIASEWQFPHKKYVDDLFAGATGVVQSTYLIKCLPTRSTEDSYSKLTPEACNTYLSGLSNIATYRGTMLIEALGQAGNAINLDDGTSQWISAGVDIVGLNRPTLTRRGYNSSLTVDGSLRGVKISDNTVVSARTYVNFTFNDVWFYVNTTEMAFTTCKFYNCVFQFAGGEAVTFSNCTGSGVTYNDDAGVTFSGTQPANVISTNTANIGF